MTVGKIHKQPQITPQQIAQKVADEGLKASVDKAIESGEKEYRAQYKKLLESKGLAKKAGVRFKQTETDVQEFLEQVYQNLPAIFKKMIDSAVEEQAKINNLTKHHQEELKRELANVIDQEFRLKGKFA